MGDHRQTGRSTTAVTTSCTITIITTCRFHMDPSGTFLQYDAKAIGSGSEGAQQALQEVYHKV